MIRVVEKEVWALTEGGLGGVRRGGLSRWNVRCVMSHLFAIQSDTLDPPHMSVN